MSKDELMKDLLEYQEKSTKVDERTAGLYSKQENTDSTELAVIDETTQCEKCKAHIAQGKSCCTCGSTVEKLTAEKKKR